MHVVPRGNQKRNGRGKKEEEKEAARDVPRNNILSCAYYYSLVATVHVKPCIIYCFIHGSAPR